MVKIAAKPKRPITPVVIASMDDHILRNTRPPRDQRGAWWRQLRAIKTHIALKTGHMRPSAAISPKATARAFAETGRTL